MALCASLTVPSLVLAPAAEGAELGGVAMSDRTKAGEQTLVLNGLGLRKRAIFKVYVAGLYLPQKASDPEAILGADTPRKMVMEFVRNVGKGSLTDAWNDCLTSNSPGASEEVKAGFERLNGWMGDVSDGDRLAFTYVPGEGTSVTVRNQAKGSVSGKPFADALFACWIGDTPPSKDFKDGLLGL